MLVDLRSDTLTQPTPGMLDAMYRARTGDDVFEEDPTVNELEDMTAALFGREAAIYCPSGTMSNQIGIKINTQPGDEVICEKTAHVYQYEGGGIAFNAGCQVKLIEGNFGRITSAQVQASVNADDVHKANSSLVCLENTANRGGGSCYNFSDIQDIRAVCDQYNLRLHLDGARLFNAMVAKNETAIQYGKVFHTISVCLNKGLGCPMGSLLIGDRAVIRKARRIRKVFGGGMRQAGFMAATGIYALQHHLNRLAEDHEKTARIAGEIAKKKFCAQLLPVESNIIIFDVADGFDAKKLVKDFLAKDIKVIAMTPTQIRLVFHLDISNEMTDYVSHCIREM